MYVYIKHKNKSYIYNCYDVCTILLLKQASILDFLIILK